jgi:ribosomal protein S12 methylthiotransferase accessory factor
MTTSPLETVVSRDVGIVHRVDEGLVGYDHPRLATHTATICDTEPLVGVHHDPNAGGMGADLTQSRRAAIGEALERYSAAYIPQSRMRLSRTQDLNQIGAAPDWLHLPPSGTPLLHWVLGDRLRVADDAVTSAPAWIAASRIFLTGIDELPELGTTTSTGLAFHPDPWRALRSGLLEVIERDAVMVSWLARAGAHELATSLQWPDARGTLVRFDRAIERYRLFALDSPLGIPVVFALALGRAGQPPVAVGAAADLTLSEACRKALIEARQTFEWTKYMRAVRRPIPDRDEIVDLDDHVAFYLDATRLTAFDHLLRLTPSSEIDLAVTEPVEGPAEQVRLILESAADAGIDCFSVDVTSPDVREFGWAIRALMPQLYPLTVGDEHRLSHPRLHALAELNPDPHPFP